MLNSLYICITIINMQSEKTKQAIKDANSRRLLCFPNKRNFAIFIAICHKSNKKRATLMHEMLKSFLSKLTEQQRDEYLELYKSLTDEQIKNVGFKTEGDGC